MKKYENKMKWTLFVLLGVFIALSNLMAFYILSSSLEKKHIELSQTHMEHQYQSFQQRMSILDQELSLLSSDNQLTYAIQSRDAETTVKKLQSLIQSSQNISSLSIFVIENDRLSFFAGDGKFQHYGQTLEEAIDIDYERLETSIWQIVQENDAYFLYVCPLKHDDSKEGCLVAEINMNHFMSELSAKNTYTYLSEHSAIVSDKYFWVDDSEYWSNRSLSDFNLADGYQTSSKTVYIFRDLTSNGDYLLQTIDLKTDSLYLKVALGLFMIFLLGLVLIYFAISRTIGSIFIQLQELKEKMQRME